MSVSNWKISTRLALGFGLIIVLLIASAFTSLTRLDDLGRNVDDLASSRVPKLVASGRAVEVLLQSARQMRNVLILEDEAQARSEIGDIRRNGLIVRELLDQIEQMLTDDAEHSLFAAIAEARMQYAPFEYQFIEAAGRGDYASAKEAMVERLRGAQSDYIDAISLLIEYEAAEGQAEARSTLAARGTSRAIIIGVALLAIFLASGAAVLITVNLKARLAQAVRMANAVAAGDFTIKADSVSRDETGQLITALMQMRQALADAVGTIRRSSESVRSASTQIAAGNAEMSSRTEEQASTLEETAASMEEITTTVKQTADNAGQANQLAIGASDVASRGGEVMGEVISTMGGISEASRKIADIISMIDGIAFQTNILALNAAVEAARAGEQGRGFAVVASEVRALAHRSAAASKEIKELIQNSVERVDGGIKLVEGAGKTMDEIVTAVKQVTDIISEIATASQEQLHGIEQVGGAVIQMDRVVQQNAAIVEESAAAAENMRVLAEQLNQAVARFKLDAAGQRPVPPAAAPADARAAPRNAPPSGNTLPKLVHNATTGQAPPKPAATTGRRAAAGASAGSSETADWKEF